MPGFYGKNCQGKLAIVAQCPGLPNELQKSKVYSFEEIEEDYINGLVISPIGKFLDKILTVDLQDIFYSNVVKCAFPSGYFMEYEIPRCQGYLHRQIKVVEPKLIIAIGTVALQYFKPGMSMQKGALQILKYHHSTLLPTYHPSYINRWIKDDQTVYMEKLTSIIGTLV